MSTTRVSVVTLLDPNVAAAMRLWAEADSRSLSRQIEFIILRALFRRGIDPTDFSGASFGALFPACGERFDKAAYLDLVERRRKDRRAPAVPPDEPSDGSPTAGDRHAGN